MLDRERYYGTVDPKISMSKIFSGKIFWLNKIVGQGLPRHFFGMTFCRWYMVMVMVSPVDNITFIERPAVFGEYFLTRVKEQNE